MSIFTRYAMDALMKTTHPEVNRKQCWNLHPHRTPCTACKDICPYGDEIFTRPNLVKDWDPCTDCGLCVSACRSGCIAPSPEQVQRDISPADSDGDTIWIGCEKSTRKNTVVRTCVSAYSWEALAYLALNKKIVLDLTPCGECENDVCAEHLRAVRRGCIDAAIRQLCRLSGRTNGIRIRHCQRAAAVIDVIRLRAEHRRAGRRCQQSGGKQRRYCLFQTRFHSAPRCFVSVVIRKI